MKKCSRCKKLKNESEFAVATRRGGSYLRSQCRECRRSQRNDYTAKLRLATIDYYSNGKRKCACCGEKEIKFLTIEHIDGCGREKRKEQGQGTAIHFWLRKNHYPTGFEILCFNCNCAKGAYGKCPHNN
jgi:hypothetical protein